MWNIDEASYELLLHWARHAQQFSPSLETAEQTLLEIKMKPTSFQSELSVSNLSSSCSFQPSFAVDITSEKKPESLEWNQKKLKIFRRLLANFRKEERREEEKWKFMVIETKERNMLKNVVHKENCFEASRAALVVWRSWAGALWRREGKRKERRDEAHFGINFTFFQLATLCAKKRLFPSAPCGTGGKASFVSSQTAAREKERNLFNKRWFYKVNQLSFSITLKVIGCEEKGGKHCKKIEKYRKEKKSELAAD